MSEQEIIQYNSESWNRQIAELNSVLDAMKSINTEHLPPNYRQKHQLILAFLPHLIAGDQDNYLMICSYSTKNFLPQLISAAKQDSSTKKINTSFVILYKFVKEKFYRTDTISDIDGNILFYYDKNFEPTNREDLIGKFLHTNRHTKDYFEIETNDVTLFKNEIIKTVDKKKQELENIGTKVELLNGQLSNILEQLKTVKQDLNFVKLSNAFTTMLRDKNREKTISFWACLALAALVTIFPTILLITHAPLDFNFLNSKIPQDIFTIKSAINILPIVTLEIILIYYFRIVLQQFYNTKGQILQLKLRAAICEFIEEYGKFIEDNKFADKHYFKQFEALIFSPIVPNPNQIPNTLDGIEQLGKMIKSCIPK